MVERPSGRRDRKKRRWAQPLSRRRWSSWRARRRSRDADGTPWRPSRAYLARGGPVARRTGRSGRRPGRGDRGIEGPSELALAMLLGQVRPDQLVHHEKQDDQTGRDQRQAHLSQQPPAPGEALCSSRMTRLPR